MSRSKTTTNKRSGLSNKTKQYADSISDVLKNDPLLAPHMALLDKQLFELAEQVNPIFAKNAAMRKQQEDLPSFTKLIKGIVPEDILDETAGYLYQQVRMYITLSTHQEHQIDKKKELGYTQKVLEQVQDIETLLYSLAGRHPFIQKEFWFEEAEKHHIDLDALAEMMLPQISALKIIASGVSTQLKEHPIKQGQPHTQARDLLFYRVCNKLKILGLKDHEAIGHGYDILAQCNIVLSKSQVSPERYLQLRRIFKRGKEYEKT